MKKLTLLEKTSGEYYKYQIGECIGEFNILDDYKSWSFKITYKGKVVADDGWYGNRLKDCKETLLDVWKSPTSWED